MPKTKELIASLLTVILLFVGILSFSTFTQITAQADTMRYCDDETIPYTEQVVSSGALTRGAGTYYNEEVIVNYDYKTVESVVLEAPIYSNPSGSDSVCAPVAGAMIAGYYDRWCNELIPNVAPGYSYNNIYYYFGDGVNNAAKVALFYDLYDAMGTDVAGPGTSLSEFMNGMTNYSGGKGYNVSYNSIKQSSTMVNISSVASNLAQNKIFALFCTSYNFIYSKSDPTSTSTKIFKRNSTAGHVMFGYGYEIYRYYKNGINFQTDYFLCVASGFSTGDAGYIKLNDYLLLEAAYVINIY